MSGGGGTTSEQWPEQREREDWEKGRWCGEREGTGRVYDISSALKSVAPTSLRYRLPCALRGKHLGAMSHMLRSRCVTSASCVMAPSPESKAKLTSSRDPNVIFFQKRVKLQKKIGGWDAK